MAWPAEAPEQKASPRQVSATGTGSSASSVRISGSSSALEAVDEGITGTLSRSLSCDACHVVSLNLGARNTNPMEFELKGDNSEIAVEAMSVLHRARQAFRDARQGPNELPAIEVSLIEEILSEIYEGTDSQWHARIRNIFRCETWERAFSSVTSTQVHLFNALNLHTLKLGRPSLWEAPSACQKFTTTCEYLISWKHWFCGLSRTSHFWLEDAPRVAQKRGMDVQTAFAGLLVFDVMSLCTGRVAFPGSDELDAIDPNKPREVPFEAVARLASQLPASSLSARHAIALDFTTGAHAILAQEVRTFAAHPAVVRDFEPPILALDGFTAVFLRKGSFKETSDISADVAKKMEELNNAEAAPEVRKAWQTTASRLAAASCSWETPVGDFRACFVSLHCCKSDCVATFMETLRDVLADYNADLHVVGMDSNCSAREVTDFQRKLCSVGFEIGSHPSRQQVTVAKQRTAFQTQVQKVGVTDISHKDYIVSWTSFRLLRGPTDYTPDLRTPYGVEQETKRCVRLPTAQWPFDHCGVATAFRPRRSRCGERLQRLRRSSRRICCGLSLLAALIATPLLSMARLRRNPYGEPGTWHSLSVPNISFAGVCETRAPCRSGWVQDGSSCYMATSKMPYLDVIKACRRANATLTSIGSETENQFVATELCPEGEFCYIGLLSSGNFQQHRWLSREPVSYMRLVIGEEHWIPLLGGPEPKRRATVISNKPGKISGCSPIFLEDRNLVTGGFGNYDLELLLPLLATVLSGGLWLAARPQTQLLSSALLCVSFIVNLGWLAPMAYISCFTEDITSQDFWLHTAHVVKTAGHSVVSLMVLRMIINRMSILRPVRTLNVIFAGIMLPFVWLFMVASIILEPMSIWRDTDSFWALSMYFAGGALVILYLSCFGLAAKELYGVWAFLHREASSGRSTVAGATLIQSVRDAKAHFFIVLTTLICSALRYVLLLLIASLFRFPMDDPIRTVSGFGVAMSVAIFITAAANVICGHALAVLNIEAGVVRPKGINVEVVERANRDVEQHRVAVRMLKAAPTSAEQLRQFAALERKVRTAADSEQKNAWLILQSAVRAESARIHWLMRCVCVREMSMPVRYSYLIDVPALEGAPRHPVPMRFRGYVEPVPDTERAYFDWLYGESAAARAALFQRVAGLLAKFNSTPWPTALGLAREEFPWMIRASGAKGMQGKCLQKTDDISPGDILTHRAASRGAAGLLGHSTESPCVVLEEVSASQLKVHKSGSEAPEVLPRSEMHTCDGGSGGAVFIPGPQKKRTRCLDKIAVDYEGKVPWPAAASLVDICRCMILVDDPYALAVLVAYLRKSMRVVRVKNRFSADVLEERAPEELQAMFHATCEGSETGTVCSTQSVMSTGESQASRFRDIAINVEVMTPNGVPFVAEIQATLSNLAILKGADQKLYTLRRMKSAAELLGTRVFDAGAEGGGDAPPPPEAAPP